MGHQKNIKLVADLIELVLPRTIAGVDVNLADRRNAGWTINLNPITAIHA